MSKFLVATMRNADETENIQTYRSSIIEFEGKNPSESEITEILRNGEVIIFMQRLSIDKKRSKTDKKAAKVGKEMEDRT